MDAALIPRRVQVERSRLPRTIILVDYLHGFGWPDCYERTRRTRKFNDADSAATFVANLAKWPTHHRLVAVYASDVSWRELDPGDLPDPRTEDDDGDA